MNCMPLWRFAECPSDTKCNAFFCMSGGHSAEGDFTVSFIARRLCMATLHEDFN